MSDDGCNVCGAKSPLFGTCEGCIVRWKLEPEISALREENKMLREKALYYASILCRASSMITIQIDPELKLISKDATAFIIKEKDNYVG